MRSPGRQRTSRRARGRAETRRRRLGPCLVSAEPRSRTAAGCAVEVRSRARHGAWTVRPAPQGDPRAAGTGAPWPAEAASGRDCATRFRPTGERSAARIDRLSAIAQAATRRTSHGRRFVTKLRERTRASRREGPARPGWVVQDRRSLATSLRDQPVLPRPVQARTPAGPRPAVGTAQPRRRRVRVEAEAPAAAPISTEGATVDRRSRCRRSSRGCRGGHTGRRAQACLSARSFPRAPTRRRSRLPATRASPDASAKPCSRRRSGC
jgi:hypothetical protein